MFIAQGGDQLLRPFGLRPGRPHDAGHGPSGRCGRRQPQTAVLAFQFGEGWINPILPTSGVTMGVLGLAGIPWDKWFKWMLPAQIYFLILALLLLIPPFFFNYQ